MIENEEARFLVDCGMLQGGRETVGRNRAPFAFDPRAIEFVLLTHAHIQESDAEQTKRHQNRDLAVADPIYPMADAKAVLGQLHAFNYGEPYSPHSSIRTRLRDTSYILGFAILEIWIKEEIRKRKLVFSGNLGQPNRPILCEPFPI